MMRVAIIHNRYQQPGGEDVVVEQEIRLLRERGHEVRLFLADNRSIQGSGDLGLAARAVWSRSSVAAVTSFLREAPPAVLHVHNTFPILSPAVYWAARRLSVPVVQTLHNYRIICPAATLFRDGRMCTDCVSRSVPWPAVLHACYRDDRRASAAAAAVLACHRAIGTWRSRIDAYTALTAFARQQFLSGGIPADRVHVRPNYREDLSSEVRSRRKDRGYALYIGRLAEEKGVRVLIESWRHVKVPLMIVGDGPLRRELEANASPRVTFRGHLAQGDVIEALLGASFVVVPSLWPEAFPMVVVEAFRLGVPLVASNLGSLAEIVEDGETGLLVIPGDADALASNAARLAGEPEMRARLGAGARAQYVARYTPSAAYDRLIEIYGLAIRTAAATRSARPWN